MGGVANSYMVPLFHSVPSAKETDRGRREMGGQLLHGPLPHSVPSESKRDRAGREMSCGPTPTCDPLFLPFCKKGRQSQERDEGVGQFLHVTLYSFPSARKADRARREMGGMANS